ncbi:plasmid mobilization relaxosome protein MobC [Adlercreutzia sp. ZJ473]|uniref:plasmid mobilization protein n=1 Tax=Adlercreutzia sp. ZJ473 TaxID=2722822 RepID=UPI00155433AA|nr:plasmid mobilization relaxosome protein MobC [Adlercreutzia sp. ZJ473]
MARKPKDPELRKTRTVNVSLTESQYQALVGEARRQGVSVGGYVRQVIDGRSVVVKHEIVLDASQVVPVLRELSRVGNNLNQAVHLCNSRKRIDDDLELRLRRQLTEIHGLCSELSRVAGGVPNGRR